MEKSGSFRPVRRIRFILYLVGFFISAGGLAGTAAAGSPALRPGEAGQPSLRVVSVAVIAEAGLRGNEAWKIGITRIMDDAGLALREIAGIKLKIKAYEYWTCEAMQKSGGSGREGRPRTPLTSPLPDFLGHLKTAGRAGCEMAVGLVPEGPDGPIDPGLADYLNGVVLMKYLKSKGGMSYVLLHEISHLFGAIDLRQKSSVMSLWNPTFGFDDFTKSIIRVNRDRSFRLGESPLSEGRTLDAIELYRDRQALGLGEEELDICLNVLAAGRSVQRTPPLRSALPGSSSPHEAARHSLKQSSINSSSTASVRSSKWT